MSISDQYNQMSLLSALFQSVAHTLIFLSGTSHYTKLILDLVSSFRFWLSDEVPPEHFGPTEFRWSQVLVLWHSPRSATCKQLLVNEPRLPYSQICSG